MSFFDPRLGAKGPVPPTFTWRMEEAPAGPPMFSDRVGYPVRPSHLLHITYEARPNASTTLIVQTVRDAGRWYVTAFCPKGADRRGSRRRAAGRRRAGPAGADAHHRHAARAQATGPRPRQAGAEDRRHPALRARGRRRSDHGEGRRRPAHRAGSLTPVRRRPAALVVTVALGATAVFADDWPGPRTVSVFSEDGGRFVRLVPGTSVGETGGFAGAPNGGPARGEFYVRHGDRSYRLVADVALANPVAPVEALVSNTGHLITFDNWHNAGYGAVVAIYDPSGRLVRAWRLEDLYDAKRIADIPRSVSSRWWRCAPRGFVDPPTQHRVYAFERLGGSFVFTLVTGAVAYTAGRARCADPIGGPFSASVHP